MSPVNYSLISVRHICRIQIIIYIYLKLLNKKNCSVNADTEKRLE
jgi:hypothetical protein